MPRPLRPLVLVLAALFGSAGCSPRTEARPRSRPNILFIAVDDLRPALGAYGDPYVKTPNIDRLARSGAVFLDAHAQQALCNPSRASLMTGLRPDSIRVWDLETDFRRTTPDVVTLPQYFMRNGYHAVSVGKIYHNVLPDSVSWSEPEYKVPGFPYDPDAVYHSHANVAIQDVRRAELVRAGRESDAVDQFGQWYLKANATESVDLPDSAYYDGAQTDYAVRRLVQLRDAAQPFFFAVGYYRPHLPFNAPKRYWDLYDPDSIPLAPNRFLPDGSPSMAINTLRELRNYADFHRAPEPSEGRLAEADAR
ncbi:MAG: sulfatase-like hydrolase/transferase, partial [Gemmatimonadales bacterium]